MKSSEASVKTEYCKVTRVLHACYEISWESGEGDLGLEISKDRTDLQTYRILFDPLFESIFSENCRAYPWVEFNQEVIREIQWSAVFISHIHDDHFSVSSLNLLNRSIPIYLYSSSPEYFELLEEMGFLRIQRIRVGDVIECGGARIQVHEAEDSEMDCIFSFSWLKYKILNCVDSWIPAKTFEELRMIHWNLILWPFQKFQEVEVLAPRLLQWESPSIHPDRLA